MLPIFQSSIKELSLLQTSWASQINPLLSNPTNNGLLLKNVSLNNGTTVVNHLLSKQMQGWIITDIDGSASIYRSQPMNDKTLTLTSDAAVTVNLWVF